jgi:hypothetical protein
LVGSFHLAQRLPRRVAIEEHRRCLVIRLVTEQL